MMKSNFAIIGVFLFGGEELGDGHQSSMEEVDLKGGRQDEVGNSSQWESA